MGLLALVACLILVGGSYRVGKASPLLQTAPTLGEAASFAVLAGSTVTNTGDTIVSGDLGVSPGSAVTGFPPGRVENGTIEAATAAAAQAQSDNTAAYNNLAGQPCDANLTGQDLGGKTLTTGVYCFDSSAQLTGALTLDAQGDPAAVFVFQIGSTLTTASNSAILLTNGASACNVFFQVGSSATLGTNTTFEGNILALQSIALNTGASVSARVLAQNGAVTLDTNTIGSGGCATGGGGGADDGGEDGGDAGEEDGEVDGEVDGEDNGEDVGGPDGGDAGEEDGGDDGVDDGEDAGVDDGEDDGVDDGGDNGVDDGEDAGVDDGGVDAGDGKDGGGADAGAELPPTGAGGLMPGGMAAGGSVVAAIVAGIIAALAAGLALRRRR